MATVELKSVTFSDKGYEIDWSLEGDFKNRITVVPLTVSYDFEIENNYFYALSFFLSSVIGPLVYEYKDIQVITPYEIPESLDIYWKNAVDKMCEAFDINDYSVKFTSTKNITLCDDIIKPDSQRIGLYFGGGVESSFALSQIHYLNPVLISIVGESWMNNDTDSFSIKSDIEDKLARDHNINFQRVTCNIRLLYSGKGDDYVNKFVTGYLFYSLAFPLCREFGLGQLWKCSELEEALSFSKTNDYSIKPTVTKDVNCHNPKYPVFMNAYNGYPKVQMLEFLSKSPFFEYMYSCFNNTDKRWCGKCSKCFRISEYCEKLGIDKSKIGMQDGIVGLREKSVIARNYWIIMDTLYGKDRLNTQKKKYQFYKQMGLWGFIKYRIQKI